MQLTYNSLSQCDLEKPACYRCRRLRIACPGYPDPWEVAHRQQNAHVASVVQARVQKAQARRRLNMPPPILSFQAPQELEVHMPSIHSLLDQYSTNSGIQVFSILPGLYKEQPAPCFAKALTAAAMVFNAAKSLDVGLFAESQKSYTKAVAALRTNITLLQNLEDDSVLVALFLLGFYEVSQDIPYYRDGNMLRLKSVRIADTAKLPHRDKYDRLSPAR